MTKKAALEELKACADKCGQISDANPFMKLKEYFQKMDAQETEEGGNEE